MVRKIIVVIAIFLVSVGATYAQTGSLQGKIVDGNGQPLIGANVVIKGTTVGTITNIDGNYLLQKIPAGTQTIVASFIGFAGFEQSVVIEDGKTTTFNFTLEEDIATLEELVVIGYGTVKKEDATGSVIAIKSDDFNKGAISTPDQLITGKVAGVQITSGGGAPGSGNTIRIRGGASLNASNDPLFVIDGVPVDNYGINGLANPLSTINPNDIESMTVLKDASAAAIYGSRGSNGVIIITTKKGEKGKPIKVEFQGTVSMHKNPKTVDVLNADDFRNAVTNYANTRFTQPESIISLLDTVHSTNWQDEIYQNAFGQDYLLSVSGAVKELPYRVSGGYYKQDGTLKTSSMERKSINVTLNPTFFDDHLKINMNAKGSVIDTRFANQGAIGAAVQFDPTKPVYNEDGSYYKWLDADSNLVDQATSNPMALLNLTNDISTVKRFTGNIQLDYKFHFLPELRANLNLGFDGSDSEGTNTVDSTASWYFFPATGSGSKTEYSQSKKNKLLDFYLMYTKDLEGIDGYFDFQGGYSYQSFYRENVNFQKSLTMGQTTGTYDTISPINYDPTEYLLLSYFGRTNLHFKDRYLLTFTLRNDNSSRFSEENRSGWFPSVAFAWNVNKEPFMQSITFLSNLKLRAGYGVTGQQEISIGDYPYQANYYLGTSTASYQFGNQFYRPYRPGAYDLAIKWEETSTLNFGIDYGFLNDRFNGSVDFYKKKSIDLINNVPVPAGSNFSNYLTTNVGDMTNTGVEFNIIARVISQRELFWELGFNCTYNKNEITRLTEYANPDYIGVNTGGISGGVGNNIQIHSVGSPANSFYVYKQVYDQNGKPIEGMYVDINEDGVVSESDMYIYKDPNADFYCGISSNLVYKNWSFSFSGRAQFNNYMYNNISSNNGELSRLFRPEGPYIANITSDGLDVNFLEPRYFSDYYIQNATFFRMDNISLSYQFKELLDSKVNLGISATVNNAFVITKYKGLDPEISGGIDNNMYPRPRVFMLGVNFQF